MVKTKRELHDKAMDVVFYADRARRRGEKEEAQRLYQRAYDLELEVANRMDPDKSRLGWSIMVRSAATLAFLSGQMRTAERLACSALAGEPHPEIIHELRDLLETIYLQPDDPAEADRVLETVHSAIDRAVADGSASPISYTETYDNVDYQPGRPGFIVGIGEEDDIEGYEVMVRRTYGRGRRVEDVASEA